MNTEVSLPMASDAPNDDIAGVPQLAVLRDEPFPKEISDSGYVNNAPDEAPAVPSVIEPTPDTMAVQTSVSPVLTPKPSLFININKRVSVPRSPTRMTADTAAVMHD